VTDATGGVVVVVVVDAEPDAEEPTGTPAVEVNVVFAAVRLLPLHPAITASKASTPNVVVSKLLRRAAIILVPPYSWGIRGQEQAVPRQPIRCTAKTTGYPGRRCGPGELAGPVCPRAA